MCSSINRMEISQALLLGSKQKRRKSEILSYLGKYFAWRVQLLVSYFQLQVEPGPDFALNDKDLESALKVLVGIKVVYHYWTPNIYSN